jgi:predicted dehydrogenase
MKNKGDNITQTTRVGLFGLGYWGSKYARLLSEIPQVTVACVVDADRGRLNGLRAGPEVARYTEASRALQKEKLDAAIVVTPASTHTALVAQCLDRSLDVLVEKPLTLSLGDAILLAKKAKHAGKLLFPGHVYAHNDGVRALSKAVGSASFGKLRYVSCLRTGLGPVRGDTNVLWDLVPHDLTILSMIGAGRPTAAIAVGRAFLRPEVEDVAFGTLLYPGGRLAHIQASWLDPHKVRKVTAVGSRRMVSFDDTSVEECVKVYERGVDLVPSATFGEFMAQVRSGDAHIPFIAAREPLRNLVQAFLDARSDPAKGGPDLKRALEIVAILEAMHQSMRDDGARSAIKWKRLAEWDGVVGG